MYHYSVNQVTQHVHYSEVPLQGVIRKGVWGGPALPLNQCGMFQKLAPITYSHVLLLLQYHDYANLGC